MYEVVFIRLDGEKSLSNTFRDLIENLSIIFKLLVFIIPA